MEEKKNTLINDKDLKKVTGGNNNNNGTDDCNATVNKNAFAYYFTISGTLTGVENLVQGTRVIIIQKNIVINNTFYNKINVPNITDYLFIGVDDVTEDTKANKVIIG